MLTFTMHLLPASVEGSPVDPSVVFCSSLHPLTRPLFPPLLPAQLCVLLRLGAVALPVQLLLSLLSLVLPAANVHASLDRRLPSCASALLVFAPVLQLPLAFTALGACRSCLQEAAVDIAHRRGSGRCILAALHNE